MAEKGRPQTGDIAPDFTLKDEHSEEFTLSGFRSKRVLLSFHPFAWTEICAQQMQSLEANIKEFGSLNTIPAGVSVDTIPSKKAWGEHLGIRNVRLLSDFWPHGETAKLYGIFREDTGSSERANIIVDEDGKIAFFKVYEMKQLPDISEILEQLRKK